MTQRVPALGELEIQVLGHLWEHKDATAKEVHAQLVTARNTSANTVQSAMERLYRKGLLARVKAGHSYRYAAIVSKAELLGELINDLVGRFHADTCSSAAAILHAAERIDAHALDCLEEEIRKRRQERAL